MFSSQSYGSTKNSQSQKMSISFKTSLGCPVFPPPFAARVNPQKDLVKLQPPKNQGKNTKTNPFGTPRSPSKPISPTETERCPSEMGRGVSAFRRWGSPCKAFGLNRASSVTSLDIDRTFWIRIRLLRFAPWISKR